MSDSRPKWMDGPGADEGVDYRIVRSMAKASDHEVEHLSGFSALDVRTLCRELLRVKEMLEMAEAEWELDREFWEGL